MTARVVRQPRAKPNRNSPDLIWLRLLRHQYLEVTVLIARNVLRTPQVFGVAEIAGGIIGIPSRMASGCSGLTANSNDFNGMIC